MTVSEKGSHFHSSRRQRYGAVFKTHLLGKPVVRVSGAENVRKILLGEHSLVSSQWPLSTQILLGSHTLLNAHAEVHRHRRKILARVFSRAALEVYLPRIQRLVCWELRGWCRRRGPIAVYASAKVLTFRIAARILLGLRLEEEQFVELSGAFEQLVENLFSLPLNVPFSGLRKLDCQSITINSHLVSIANEEETELLSKYLEENQALGSSVWIGMFENKIGTMK
ncbi:PREDICTED: cytochrome P450 26C1-like, partial [Thamnophis sirtalis]|uniref:Cytochrome P450 26C1-like n=1 Tax=Thamnophis sirtalis TaxID=35019 RepID=A0A6I9YKE0_9SAUR